MAALQPIQLPELPDVIRGVTLPQYVATLALRERDPELRRLMDIRILYLLGVGEWIKAEIHLRVMRMADPAQMLVSVPFQLHY